MPPSVRGLADVLDARQLADQYVVSSRIGSDSSSETPHVRKKRSLGSTSTWRRSSPSNGGP
jgi:hypothetical protein